MIKSMHVFNALDEVYSEGMNVKQANDAIKNYLVDNGFWVEPEAEISKQIMSVDELPDDLDELEEVMTKLLNNNISRDEAIRFIEIMSTEEAESLLTETGL